MLRVPVGQGEAGVAMQQVLMSPVLLATVAGLAISLLQVPLPPTVCCLCSRNQHKITCNPVVSSLKGTTCPVELDPIATTKSASLMLNAHIHGTCCGVHACCIQPTVLHARSRPTIRVDLQPICCLACRGRPDGAHLGIVTCWHCSTVPCSLVPASCLGQLHNRVLGYRMNHFCCLPM